MFLRLAAANTTIKAYVHALNAKDRTAADKVTCPPFRTSDGNFTFEAVPGPIPVRFEADPATQTTRGVDAKVTESIGGATMFRTFLVVRTSGSWLICGIDDGAPGPTAAGFGN